MTIKFPVRKPDGSHELIIEGSGFPSSQDVLDAWLRAWASANEIWERTWLGVEVTVERLTYGDEFSAPPSGRVEQDGRVILRLHARPSSTWWKDWSAKLFKELVTAFPGVELVTVRSAQ